MQSQLSVRVKDDTSQAGGFALLEITPLERLPRVVTVRIGRSDGGEGKRYLGPSGFHASPHHFRAEALSIENGTATLRLGPAAVNQLCRSANRPVELFFPQLNRSAVVTWPDIPQGDVSLDPLNGPEGAALEADNAVAAVTGQTDAGGTKSETECEGSSPAGRIAGGPTAGEGPSAPGVDQRPAGGRLTALAVVLVAFLVLQGAAAVWLWTDNRALAQAQEDLTATNATLQDEIADLRQSIAENDDGGDIAQALNLLVTEPLPERTPRGEILDASLSESDLLARGESHWSNWENSRNGEEAAEAYYWFRLAARQGNGDAIVRVGVLHLYDDLPGIQRAPGVAFLLVMIGGSLPPPSPAGARDSAAETDAPAEFGLRAAEYAIGGVGIDGVADAAAVAAWLGSQYNRRWE